MTSEEIAECIYTPEQLTLSDILMTFYLGLELVRHAQLHYHSRLGLIKKKFDYPYHFKQTTFFFSMSTVIVFQF